MLAPGCGVTVEVWFVPKESWLVFASSYGWQATHTLYPPDTLFQRGENHVDVS